MLTFMPVSTKGKKKARRLQQVATWLQATFPAPTPIQVQIVDEIPHPDPGTVGLCDFKTEPEPVCVIYVDVKGDAAWMTETLLHEYTHALTLPFLLPYQKVHGDEFFIMLGRIYRAFYEEGGLEASMGL